MHDYTFSTHAKQQQYLTVSFDCNHILTNFRNSKYGEIYQWSRLQSMVCGCIHLSQTLDYNEKLVTVVQSKLDHPIGKTVTKKIQDY